MAEKYTANKAKYATTRRARRASSTSSRSHDAGYFNKDFASAKFEDGVKAARPPARAPSTRC